MRGNSHVRFSGEGAAERLPPYPTYGNQNAARSPKRGWTKVTVVLFDRQIAYLDRLAIDLRLKSGWAVSRAEIIRALIDAVADSGIELEDVRSEMELRELFAPNQCSGESRVNLTLRTDEGLPVRTPGRAGLIAIDLSVRSPRLRRRHTGVI
jgi:hypothetical protein